LEVQVPRVDGPEYKTVQIALEFAELYLDKTGVYHALTSIERKKAAEKYDARIQANALVLRELIRRYENTPNPQRAIKNYGRCGCLRR
jgi:hypothetical protein